MSNTSAHQHVKMIVYAFPGLGTDRRMFDLQTDLDCELRIPEWIAPHKNETMNHYAGRMAQLLDISQPFSIMGVSLGGMMCMELAKYLQPEKIILVSSCKTRSELPPQIQLGKYVGGAGLASISFIRRAIKVYNQRMGDLPPEMKMVFDEMVTTVNGEFLKWAATAITRWQNETIHDNIIHIHGTHDKVLPYKYVKADITVMGGSHYMVGTRSEEVNALIERALGLP